MATEIRHRDADSFPSWAKGMKPLLSEFLFEKNDEETRTKITEALTQYMTGLTDISQSQVTVNDSNNTTAVTEAHAFVVDVAAADSNDGDMMRVRIVIC